MDKRDPRYRADLRKRVKRLYEAGESMEAVAEKCEISRTRVTQLLDEMAVQRRPRGRPRKHRHDTPRAA